MRFSLASLLLLVPLWCSAPAAAADPISAAQRLPSDTVLLVQIRDVEELQKAWGDSLLGKMMADPVMKEFLDQFEQHWAQAADGFEAATGVELGDALKSFQGEIAVAVTTSANRPPNLIVLVNFGDAGETVEKLLAKAGDALRNEGWMASEEEYDGTELTIHKNADDPGAPTLVTCTKDGTLLVASSVDAAKAVLTRWDGEHDRTLAKKAVYGYIMSKCQPNGVPSQMSWYLDPIGALRAAINASGEAQAQMVLGFLPTLGLDKLRGIGGTIDMSQGEFDSVSRTLVYMEPPRKGLLGLLEFPARNLEPPAWVSARTTSYTATNWDIKAAYRSIESTYDSFAGEGQLGQLVDQLANQPGGPNIHIKKDLIDQFSGTFHIVADEAHGEDAGERYLFVLGLDDEGPMKKTLASLAALPGFPGKTRDFNGTAIYEMDLPLGEPVTAGIAVARGGLVIATDVTALEEMIRGNPDETLAASPAFKSVARLFPQGTSSLSFSRSDVQIKLLLEMLKDESVQQAISAMDLPLDLSTLPEFEKIKQYFTPTGGYMQPDENGLFLVNFSLKE